MLSRLACCGALDLVYYSYLSSHRQQVCSIFYVARVRYMLIWYMLSYKFPDDMELHYSDVNLPCVENNLLEDLHSTNSWHSHLLLSIVVL